MHLVTEAILLVNKRGRQERLSSTNWRHRSVTSPEKMYVELMGGDSNLAVTTNMQTRLKQVDSLINLEALAHEISPATFANLSRSTLA